MEFKNFTLRCHSIQNSDNYIGSFDIRFVKSQYSVFHWSIFDNSGLSEEGSVYNTITSGQITFNVQLSPQKNYFVILTEIDNNNKAILSRVWEFISGQSLYDTTPEARVQQINDTVQDTTNHPYWAPIFDSNVVPFNEPFFPTLTFEDIGSGYFNGFNSFNGFGFDTPTDSLNRNDDIHDYGTKQIEYIYKTSEPTKTQYLQPQHCNAFVAYDLLELSDNLNLPDPIKAQPYEVQRVSPVPHSPHSPTFSVNRLPQAEDWVLKTNEITVNYIADADQKPHMYDVELIAMNDPMCEHDADVYGTVEDVKTNHMSTATEDELEQLLRELDMMIPTCEQTQPEDELTYEFEDWEADIESVISDLINCSKTVLSNSRNHVMLLEDYCADDIDNLYITPIPIPPPLPKAFKISHKSSKSHLVPFSEQVEQTSKRILSQTDTTNTNSTTKKRKWYSLF